MLPVDFDLVGLISVYQTSRYAGYKAEGSALSPEQRFSPGCR